MSTDRELPWPYLRCDTPNLDGIDCVGTVLHDSDNVDRCSAHYAHRFGQPTMTKGDM